MFNEVKKTTLSITLEPEDGKIGQHVHIEGAPDDLCVAYVELSKALLKKFEEALGKEMTQGLYAISQRLVLEGSCMRDTYKEHEKTFNRIKPLMDIFGKTFTEDGKEVKDGDDE